MCTASHPTPRLPCTEPHNLHIDNNLMPGLDLALALQLPSRRDEALTAGGEAMSAIVRIVWVVTLVAFVSGCSTYRVVAGGPPAAAMSPEVVWSPDVRAGERVRVTLADGRQYAGRLVSLRADEVVLQPDRSTRDRMIRLSESGPPGSPIEAQRDGSVMIAADHVSTVEKRVGSAGKSGLLLLGIIGGLVAVVGIVFATSESFDVGMMD